MYACSSFVKTTVPRLVEMCWQDSAGYSAVVVKYHDNGLFANMLQVLDPLLLSHPESSVLVDWQRKGTEGHFQYGPEGFDLWTHLFEHCSRCHSIAAESGGEAPSDAVVLTGRCNPVFMNMLRGYVWTLPEEALTDFRRRYAAASVGAVRPVPRVRDRVDEICGAWESTKAYAVGVHKRLGTPEVAACQLSQRAPAPSEFIACARAALMKVEASTRRVVFLATDDLNAVEAFIDAFPPDGSGGAQLVCRSGVKRTEGGLREDGVDNEVHRSPCEAQDAEDALIDALCLARCSDLVCIDSNLSIFVALTNPEIRLHPLNSILPLGWEEEAERPTEPVYQSYEVICKPCVFLRKGPSAASELMGAKKPGQTVHTTGRGFDGWVEIQGGGWMLTDGERQAQGRGLGMLMKPVGDVHDERTRTFQP